ncbi:MAG: potassium-transporting ATPase subunit KdpA [Anaerolineae bacterium]|nr:potassium-transporting ATPase subunit KdpA [Anaerolineae bacterium]
MGFSEWLQIALYLGILLLLVKPLGSYMAKVYRGEYNFLSWIELPLYRVLGVNPAQEMNWRVYALAMLIFNILGLGVLYVLQRIQASLPLNPAELPDVPADTAFNAAVSFATNTNWQSYGGETTMSYLTQMLGLTVQNFVSAATGMAILAALMRGLARKSAQTIGNFWVDAVRGVLYILLPLSFILALLLVSEGVVQTFSGPHTVQTLEAAEQTLAVGPAASQVAIKQLGTNGGGFFNVNSAHPFENPTPLSNFLQMLAILLIPAALCYTFGAMIDDTRQGWAVLVVMLLIFVPLALATVLAEQNGNPLYDGLGIDQTDGNMEGKEVRFGVVNSALWATATTAASNGSVNSMHDSYTPLGGMIPLWLMQLGEVIFGGVGSGLYGLLIFAIVAVFIAGLMVGRTPEYLGKKIDVFEMKMASLVILLPPLLVLFGTAVSVMTDTGITSMQDAGPHGFSETLYAYSSAGNNNGSAFAGFNANTPFQNTMLGVVMFLARYGLAIPVLAIAGSLAAKKKIPSGSGTLPTHTPLFVIWLAMVVIVVGALSFLPALALGPVVEHLLLDAGRLF